jgi:hypothetical protein
MTGPLDDVASPVLPPTDWKSIQKQQRFIRRACQFALVIMAAVVLVVAWDLYDQPAHSYEVGANSTTWSADVTTALAKLPSGGNYRPVGEFRVLPGVGRVFDVVVDQYPRRKGKMVMFLTKVDANGAGLVYLDDFPPPSDTCDYHLGGPWWELSPLNDATMGCARGFHFTPGG